MTLPVSQLPGVEERVWDALITVDPVAPIQRRLRQPDRLRRWTLIWSVLGVTDKNTIVTDFRTAKGGAGTFEITPPDVGAAVRVRFLTDTLRWSLPEPGRYEVQAQVEEVLHGITT